MARHLAQVRDARPDDLDAIVDLWALGGRAVDATPRARVDAEVALASLAGSSEERLLVVEVAGRLAAMMHLQRGQLSPVHSDQAVHTSYLLVHPEFRRQGLAHLLMEAAVSWAEEKDAVQITVVTDSQSRETNRYFARLGMSTLATVRNAPTAVLRMRLAPRGLAERQRGQVLAARRSMRRRLSAG